MTVPGLFKKDRKQKAKQTEKDSRESSENRKGHQKKLMTHQERWGE